MKTLSELDGVKHQDLKVVTASALDIAKQMQIINLHLAELSHAITSVPVFFTKSANTGHYGLSGLISLDSKCAAMVKDGRWQGTYLPSFLQTYPIFLMRKGEDSEDYTLGIDETSAAFSSTEGQPLFDAPSKPSDYLQQVKATLEADLKGNAMTFQFMRTLQELDLVKAINIIVAYEDGTKQSLTGLYTVDEDKLQSLTQEQVYELQQNGYLLLMNAMLLSLFQLNSLLQKHNEQLPDDRITHVTMETAKSTH